MPATTQLLSIEDSFNILLAVQGIAAIPNPAAGIPEIDEAFNTLEETSQALQLKGWWFNQQTGGNFDPDADVIIHSSTISEGWHNNLPYEFVYYATIRAARIHQRRFLTSQEVEAFTAQEEALALAMLQQAHVRSSNATYSFSDFPAELKGMGIDEVLFLKGDVDEKIKTLQLGAILAETDAKKKTTDLQVDPELARFQNEGTITTYQDYPTELRMLGFTEAVFYELPAWKKTEAERDAVKLRTARATVTTETADELSAVNDILRLLGEAPVSALNVNALASEAWRVLYQIDQQIQNKDWFFNKDDQKKLTANDYSTYTVKDSSNIISIDPDLSSARLRRTFPKEVSASVVVAGEAFSTDNTVKLAVQTTEDVQILAGDWITVAGLSFFDYNAGLNALCNGTFQLISVSTEDLSDYIEITYTARGNLTIDSSGLDSGPTSFAVVSRRLYNVEKNDWEWTGSFNATVRYRRALYDVPSAYLHWLVALTAARLAESYPTGQTELQRVYQNEQEARMAFKALEDEQADFTIFDNFDTQIILGRNRNFVI